MPVELARGSPRNVIEFGGSNGQCGAEACIEFEKREICMMARSATWRVLV